MNKVLEGELRKLGASIGGNLYFAYYSDAEAALDLQDMLSWLGCKVAPAKQAGAQLSSCTVAVLIEPSRKIDQKAFLAELRAVKARDCRYRRLSLQGEPPGLQGSKLLSMLCWLGGEKAQREWSELAAEADRDVKSTLGEIDRLSRWPDTASGMLVWGPVFRNRFAKRLIKEARYEEALNVLAAGDAVYRSMRGQQLTALAYARCGRVKEAQQILEGLYRQGHRDPETLGILARTYMDSYDRSRERKELEQSYKLYAEAFRNFPSDEYTGINAAAKSLFLGDESAAARLAQAVQTAIGEEKPTYWILAAKAEAELIQKKYSEAAKLYRDAVVLAPEEIGSHSSTWLQARRIMNVLKTGPEDRAKVQTAFRDMVDASPGPRVFQPPCRRLRVFAFDPAAGRRLETAAINEVTLTIPWEADEEGKSTLAKGPVGEYLEVVDHDPASDCFYEPVDLDDPRLLAMDGLAPSEGDPRFHQQMVFAVGMNLINHFERALGRKVLWAPHGKQFVRRLRIYPHALREANAYYSPAKKAVLFGYFAPPAETAGTFGTVFTCLSHDVIAHEMTHALLDGLHPRFDEESNVDVAAFHEAFADIVAIFQHFSHAEVLEHEIGRTRGDLGTENILSQLAQEFGYGTGERGALRDALGEVDERTGEWRRKQPSPDALKGVAEEHDRGSVLVAALFDAFLRIYEARTADLRRIATQGTGVLAAGALHPDLVRRLAAEAAKTATHFLRLCIRALDYCPPVDITFGDYLRAAITADVDFEHEDKHNYRLALIESFQRRGIYPCDVRSLSVESVLWRPPRRVEVSLGLLFGEGSELKPEWQPMRDRFQLWKKMESNKAAVMAWLRENCHSSVADEFGIAIGFDSPKSVFGKDGKPDVEVHSVRVARRNTQSGSTVTDLVVEIIQRRRGYFDKDVQAGVDEGKIKGKAADFNFYGGCTLLIDPATKRIRFAITKHVLSDVRLNREREFRTKEDNSPAFTYARRARGMRSESDEPIAALHRRF